MSYFGAGDGNLRDVFEQGIWLRGVDQGTAILRERAGAHEDFDIQHKAVRAVWVETLHEILARRGLCRCVRDTDPCWRRAHPDEQDYGTWGTAISFGQFTGSILDCIVGTATTKGRLVPAEEAIPRVRPVDKDGHFE